MDNEWRYVRLRSGRSIVARRGSPVDAAFPDDEVGEPEPGIPMPLSLGFLGDLLWMRLPETRPFLAERIRRAVEDAIDSDRELWRLTPGEIAPDALWWPVLKPALEAYPASHGSLVRQLAVVREAYLAEGPEQEPIRYALDAYVFDWLRTPEHLSVVRTVDPELANLILGQPTP